MTLQIEFVETVPDRMEEGVLYVSMFHGAAIHRCACGCGEEVVTPFHPVHGWTLSYDGMGLSLAPSIGNWGFPCRSHYYITDSEVRWCPRWMDRDAVIERDEQETTPSKEQHGSEEWTWWPWSKKKKNRKKKSWD